MSATFKITKIQVITGALQLCQVLAEGETPSPQKSTDCTVFLQAMLKSWDKKGWQAHLYQTINWTSIAAHNPYTIGEGGGVDVTNVRPTRVPQAYTRSTSGNDVPLMLLTRQQWERLTPKSSSGPPNSFYYDAQLDTGLFYAWPVNPDTSLTFFALIERPISDIAAADASTFDIPQEGYLALIWGLADQIKLIMGCPVDVRREIAATAPAMIDTYISEEEEDGSVYFQPSPQGGFQYARR